jgi:hypothetical protein
MPAYPRARGYCCKAQRHYIRGLVGKMRGGERLLQRADARRMTLPQTTGQNPLFLIIYVSSLIC